jgi:hypothetical protein
MSKRWTDDDLKKLPPGMVNVSNMGQKISISAQKNARNTQNVSRNEKIDSQIEENVSAIGSVRESKMNKTEAQFAQLLDLQLKAGELLWWEFEPMNLRLGVNCYYRIDFMVMEKSGRLVAYEVKGHWEDDALVKIRTAAEKFPWPFIAVRWDRKEKKWEYRKF